MQKGILSNLPSNIRDSNPRLYRLGGVTWTNKIDNQILVAMTYSTKVDNTQIICLSMEIFVFLKHIWVGVV